MTAGGGIAGKSFGLGVYAMIRDASGRFLLLRRSRDSKFGPRQWDAPGGKVEPGETFDAALFREVEEETGLQIALERFAGASQILLRDLQVILIYMKARLVSGEVRLNGEHEEFAWFKPEDFPHDEVSVMLDNFLKVAGPNWQRDEMDARLGTVPPDA